MPPPGGSLPKVPGKQPTKASEESTGQENGSQAQQAKARAEEEARLAKLQKCSEFLSAQLGPAHQTTRQMEAEAAGLRAKLQAAKPLGYQLQSAQSKLQQLEQGLLRAHEEMDRIEEEFTQLTARKEATLEKGRALQRQVSLAKQEVQRLACLVAQTKEGEEVAEGS